MTVDLVDFVFTVTDPIKIANAKNIIIICVFACVTNACRNI